MISFNSVVPKSDSNLLNWSRPPNLGNTFSYAGPPLLAFYVEIIGPQGLGYNLKTRVPSHTTDGVQTGLHPMFMGDAREERDQKRILKGQGDSVLPTHSQPWLGEEKLVQG